MTLMLHAGAETVDYDGLRALETPEASETHVPIAHHMVVDMVKYSLGFYGHDLIAENFGVTPDGMRFFGVLSLRSPYGDYVDTVGLRNSHDKRFPIGISIGSRVFVCDNLAFGGEVRISRKHTKFAQRDLRHLTSRAVGRLGERFLQIDERIARYRDRRITNPQAHNLVIKATDCGAITPSQIPGVLQEWRTPSHEDFRPRNAWSLFNAATEVMKGINPNTVVHRTQALHGLFDGLVGLS